MPMEKKLSPFHDIHLWHDKSKGILNCVIEIPKDSNAKMEISTKEPFNPIKQDVKNGKLRVVADLAPHKGYPWNYGAFPQTWENPCHKHPETDAFGDNDPLDVCEISSVIAARGEVRQVKILGTLALIDEGETDWKVICIDVHDPLSEKLNDIDDLERERPGYIKMMHDWFRDYKIPDGKPPNKFAFDGAAKNREYAMRVIEENHSFWRDLVTHKIPHAGKKGNGDSYEIALPLRHYHVKESGDPTTTAYRVHFQNLEDKTISPFHDIPLFHNKAEHIYNVVIEIPKDTNAKMEISTKEEFNPIKQDVKNGKLRVVADLPNHKGYPWNYGAFPQTWENPCHKHPETDAFGDNDPLDVCEISSVPATRGEIRHVKILGTLALIDEGETDWKVICIDVHDPLAEKVNDITDLERERPGYVQMMHDWFRDYKIPDGKPANKFAFDGAAKNREYALAVIAENHQFWHDLRSGKIPHTGKKGNGDSYEISIKSAL